MYRGVFTDEELAATAATAQIATAALITPINTICFLSIFSPPFFALPILTI
jgi:hypothetical protein